MKRNHWNQKRLMILLTTLLSLSLVGNVWAAGGLTEITAYLNTSITVMLHGKPFEAYDTDGTKYVPITYKGRTYLPMRAVAEAVGLKVTWDPNTETAFLGNEAGQIDPNKITWIKASPEFGGYAPRYRLKSRTPDELTTATGITFEHGFVTDGGAGVAEHIDTNYEFGKFRASIWVQDTDTDRAELVVKVEDQDWVMMKQIKVKNGQMVEFEVDVKDAKQINVWVEGDKSILGNPELGK